MRERDIVVGIHSIVEALKNPARTNYLLYSCDEGIQEFQKKAGVHPRKFDVELRMMNPHEVQEEAKRIFYEFDFTYNRVPSNTFLLTSPLPEREPTWLYEKVAQGPVKLLCLDQVTDAHNGAAIMRTAAFYGVDAILISMKGSFGIGPHFHRIASGASEYVEVVKCASLPKILTKLETLGVECIGLSEHAEGEVSARGEADKICLVLGAEDVGLSNAVMRVLKRKVAFVPKGKIQSLNVSVAAAIAMEKYFL